MENRTEFAFDMLALFIRFGFGIKYTKVYSRLVHDFFLLDL